VKLSIIIATHARPESLARLIASLASQLRKGEHELFVAENGTPSPAAIDQSSYRTNAEIVHLYEARTGKCRVQNRAIAAARGALIAAGGFAASGQLKAQSMARGAVALTLGVSSAASVAGRARAVASLSIGVSGIFKAAAAGRSEAKVALVGLPLASTREASWPLLSLLA